MSSIYADRTLYAGGVYDAVCRAIYTNISVNCIRYVVTGSFNKVDH